MSEGDKINKKRVLFLFVYLVPTISFSIYLRKEIFYLCLNESSFNFFRFLWCFFSAIWGFSAVVLYFIYSKECSFRHYIITFPILCLAYAAMIFSLLHLWPNTSNFVFYYLSFALCFMLGFKNVEPLGWVHDILKCFAGLVK
jgi:hypothetical protein